MSEKKREQTGGTGKAKDKVKAAPTPPPEDKKDTGREANGKWKPGQSGNPKGRPAGSFSLVALLKEALQDLAFDLDGKKMDKTHAQLLIKKMLKLAIKDGDVRMISQILNHVDGLPMQKTELTGKDGGPLEYTGVFEEFASRINGIASRQDKGEDTGEGES